MRIILLLSLLIFAGCTKKISSIQGVAHMHPYHIQIGNSLSSKEKKEISKLIDSIFTEIDEVYNHWNPNSELSRNSLTPKVQSILSLAHFFSEVTEGLYDPTLGAPIQAFKEEGKLPSPFLETIYDLDGMLKGFTVDLILEKLTEKGYKNLYVEWGGEISTRGSHPKGRPWRILVNQTPLDLVNAAIATSGCQEQLWKIDNRIYTHIIDPYSLKMIEVTTNQVHQVTVLAPTCAFADALATACMACGSLENAYALAKKIKHQFPEVDFWITSYDL